MTEPRRKFNAKTPSFQPSVLALSNKFLALSPKLNDIPVFVPSGAPEKSGSAHHETVEPQGPMLAFTPRRFNASTPSFMPAMDSYSSTQDLYLPASGMGSTTSTQPSAVLLANPYLHSIAQGAGSLLGTDFGFHSQNPLAYSLSFHLYAPDPPPRVAAHLPGHLSTVNGLFIPNNLRELLTKKNAASIQTMPRLSLPEHVGVFHSLVPIDLSLEPVSKVYNVPSFVYKVALSDDGLPYALVRIDYQNRIQILNKEPFSTVKRWKALRNANVVPLVDAFTTVAFGVHGETSLCLAYEYFPLLNTLEETHVARKVGLRPRPVTEPVLWAYLVQLVNALRAIHSAGLSAGASLNLSKIIITNENRIRLAACGVTDILHYDSESKLREEQGDAAASAFLRARDFENLAEVMNQLVRTVSPGATQADMMSYFSSDLVQAMGALNSTAPEQFDIDAFYKEHVSLHALDVVNDLQTLADFFEAKLLSEVENARLFRLMAKINYLIAKPEQENEFRENLLIIDLFHQFLFLTVDEFGKPAVDLSRLLVNLNKLDVGVDEKILLVSSDETTCIIMSYKEIKDLVVQTFRAVYRG